jgi:large subunit ribosomal protein L22
MSKQAKARRLKGVEAMAKVRTLRTSPRKLNLVAQSIRGLKVQRALNELEFSPKRIAKDVRKALYSAISNAENNHNLDIDSLVVAEAFVGKNLVMKRFAARARGRASRIEKPFSERSASPRPTPSWWPRTSPSSSSAGWPSAAR